MSKHKSPHRNLHTYAKAYSLARTAIRGVVNDPDSVMDKNNLQHYKALCIKWARSEKEMAKALALVLPTA
jgi:hypothetical protein